MKLVGSDRNVIVAEAAQLLDDMDAYRAMTMAHNPYGDGKAGEDCRCAGKRMKSGEY